MSKTDILAKIILRLLTVVAFVFSFIGYVIAVRPQFQKVTNDYTLGLIEGGLFVFVVTALPLLYTILTEREKKKEVS